MAAPKENLLSLGQLNSSEKNTFTKQREFCGNKSVNMPVSLQDDSSALHSQEHLVMHLQQRWQELKEREYTAQQQNRQLLQQFEKAQDTLKEMLARNAAMKIIRMEYERYLEENSPRWQQQLKEKTQAAQKKKIDDYLSSCLKNAEVMKSSAGPPTKAQKNTPTPKGYTDYYQDGSSHLLHTQSSWLTHSQSQTARFPTRVPQSFLQPPIIPHPYPLHYPASTPGYYHPWPRQDLQSWASPQPDYPWSQPAGAAGTLSYSEALWGQPCVEEPSRESVVSQIVGEDNKMDGALSSQRERSHRSSSSRLSHELDVKPVRLSSSHGESSESGRDSSVGSGEIRKKEGGRKQHASSDSERCSSQESYGNSSAIPVASVAVIQSSESNASSEKSSRSSTRRTKRSGGLSVRSPRSEKVAEEKTTGEGDDSESQHTGEESGSSSEAYKSEKEGTQNHEEKTDSCKESGPQREKESESDNVKNENDDAGEAEEQESSSSEQSSTDEKVEDESEKNLEDEEEKENNQTNKEQGDSDVEQGGDNVSAKKDATGEEADTSVEDEMEEQGGKEQPTRLKNEDTENREQGSASSQDEEEGSEGIEEEENEESNEQEVGESEKETRSEEDEIDSDDCIITTQEKRSKQMPTEEAAQDEEEGETGSCNDDSNEVSDEDDVENLLAPQEQTQEKETDLKAEEKPKGSFHNMGISQVEHDRSKTDDPNDSDEFDHFYD